MDDSTNTPLKRCTKCGNEYIATIQFFYRCNSTKDGLRPDCKQCVNTAMKQKRDAIRPPKPIIPDGYKQCFTCKQIKVASREFFYVNGYASDGLEYHCKVCSKNYAKSRYIPKREPRPIAREGYKICIVCKRELLAVSDNFHISSITNDGLRYECRECRSKMGKSARLNPDVKAKEHALNKRWYTTHKEQKAAYQKVHKERIRTYQHWYSETFAEQKKAYRLIHIEHLRERGRLYYREHREQYRERARVYYQTEKGRAIRKAKEHRRRARLLAVPHTLTADQILLKLRLQRFRCYYCHDKFERRNGKYIYHLDHVIPLSRPEAGPRHDMSYTVLACPTCNLRKSNKLLSEWPEGNRLL